MLIFTAEMDDESFVIQNSLFQQRGIVNRADDVNGGREKEGHANGNMNGVPECQ